MSVSASLLSVAEVVARVFPTGTRSLTRRDEPISSWPLCPDHPPDLFAIAAHLLEIAGAYHYFAPGAPDDGRPRNGKILQIPDRQLRDATKAGRVWAKAPIVPDLLDRIWEQLGQHGKRPVFAQHDPDGTPEPWWALAHLLLVAADEACGDVGYGAFHHFGTSREAADPSWVFHATFFPYINRIDRLHKINRRGGGDGHIRYFPQEASICAKADDDVVCVQPKSRTPAFGCTVRSLSHNLALLPPRGIAKAAWQRPPEALRDDDEAALNLVLIPFPFTIAAKSFRPSIRLTPQAAKNGDVPGQTPWGLFSLRQDWLTSPDIDAADALATFTKELIAAAQMDVGKVHGVVFPEYAINWDIYCAIVAKLRSDCPDVEFLVAGSSDNCRGERGNFALSTVISKSSDGKSDVAISTSRSKHHRWRLDERQISTYALASTLDPRVTWWENVPSPKREVHINVFRGSSTFATMICEDLARVDPAHALIRSIGPSLVFVLLMDGPQIRERWAARYATVLADDPGSSVLTLTSMGLLDRANRAGMRDPSTSVALWKEDTGKTVEIPFQPGCHGIVVTLSGHRTTEFTLDGRPNVDGRAWRFHGYQPLRIAPSNPEVSRMLAFVTGQPSSGTSDPGAAPTAASTSHFGAATEPEATPARLRRRKGRASATAR